MKSAQKFINILTTVFLLSSISTYSDDKAKLESDKNDEQQVERYAPQSNDEVNIKDPIVKKN